MKMKKQISKTLGCKECPMMKEMDKTMKGKSHSKKMPKEMESMKEDSMEEGEE